MTKKFIAASFLAALTLAASAHERSEAELRQAAASVLSQASNGSKGSKVKARSAQALRVLAKNSEVSVLGYTDGGFAVIANDDQFKPVFGYSDEAYNAGDVNPAFEWYINTLNASLAEAKAEGRALESVKPSAAYAQQIDELLTCRWGQDAPYNLYTPKYTDTKTGAKVNYVTGCVATAMAQILYYHKSPVKGEGEVMYDFMPGGGEPSQTLEADFSDTYYDWANMLDTYTAGAYNDAQAAAVATLMQHCGYSVRMQYTKSGSGAYLDTACRAFRENFGCNPWVRHYNRDYFNVTEWMDILYRELNDRCPVLYGGQSSAGGHCFVLDGYNQDGLVHVNWGWNGKQNGYFDIASLNGYSTGQSMVEVRLASDDRYVGEYHSLWEFTGNLVIDASDYAVTVSCDGNLYNYDSDEFTGSILLMARNTASGKEYKLTQIKRFESRPSRYGGTLGTATARVSNLPDGSYRLYVASLGDEEKEPQPVRSHEGVCNSYMLTVEGGEIVECEPDNDSSWTSGIGDITAADPNGNVRVFDLQGRQLYTAPAASFSISNVPATGVLIVKNGTKTIKVVK